MKKFGVISLALSAILANSIFASEVGTDKKVFINVETKGGAEILSSELEYKQYLDKKLEFSMKEQERIARLEAQCDQINVLKIAVSKLIKQIGEKPNSQNNQLIIIEIEKLKKEIEGLSKVNENLQLENSKFKEDIKKLNQALNKMSSKNAKKLENNFLEDTKNKNVKIIPSSEDSNSTAIAEVKKVECDTTTVKVFNKKKIKESYYKFSPDKEFTVQENIKNNTVKIYEFPVLGEPEIGKFTPGEKFIADKYTAAGWVHAKGKGWVKGYLLSPKLLKSKTAKFDSNNTAFITKTVKDCK